MLLSPIVVVGLGFVLARITVSIWGTWSWIPVIIYYWGVLAALIAWGGGREAVRRWLQPSRTGRWIWILRVLLLAVPALVLPMRFSRAGIHERLVATAYLPGEALKTIPL